MTCFMVWSSSRVPAFCTRSIAMVWSTSQARSRICMYIYYYTCIYGEAYMRNTDGMISWWRTFWNVLWLIGMWSKEKGEKNRFMTFRRTDCNFVLYIFACMSGEKLVEHTILHTCDTSLGGEIDFFEDQKAGKEVLHAHVRNRVDHYQCWGTNGGGAGGPKHVPPTRPPISIRPKPHLQPPPHPSHFCPQRLLSLPIETWWTPACILHCWLHTVNSSCTRQDLFPNRHSSHSFRCVQHCSIKTFVPPCSTGGSLNLIRIRTKTRTRKRLMGMSCGNARRTRD